MLVFHLRHLRIEIHFFFVAIITFACLFDPTGIALLGIFASMLHELGHFLFLWLFDCKPSKLSFELAGITVVKSGYHLPMTKEVLVLLSGSAVNFLFMLLCYPFFPIFAVIHLLIGIFNLLPFPMLDGGKLLSLWLTRILTPERASKVELIIQIVFLVFISAICISTMQQGEPNWLLLVTIIYLFSLILFRQN